MEEITNRIIKTELVRWRELQWLQGRLKHISPRNREKLKENLKANSFLQPFNVWENGGMLWCLDGHHRKMAMEELERDGMKIPEMLPANFIECSDMKEAKKLLLVYSSIFAYVDKKQAKALLEQYDEELKNQIDIPGVEIQEQAEMDERPDMEFTEELLEEHNYLVLYFDNVVDWQQALSLFDVKTVKALQSKPGFEKFGVGRVLRGRTAIDDLMRKVRGAVI